MSFTLKQKIERRFNDLKNDASDFLESWQILSEWIQPNRGSFDDADPEKGTLLDNQDNINNNPRLANRTFAAGMYSGMTNPSRNWFRLEIEDEEEENSHAVKVWLEALEKKTRTIFAQSNIYQSFYSMYEEISMFGSTAALMEEDFEKVVRLRTFTAGEYFLGNDNNGKVNTFAREFAMSISNIVDEFGIDNVSPGVKSQYNNKNLDSTVIVRHLITPRKYIANDNKSNLNMPFASYYWEKGGEETKLLKESGYKQFPILAPQWGRTKTSDIYGKGSPGWDSIADIKQMQTMEKDKLYNLALISDPPVTIDSDIEGIDLQPGGITRVNSITSTNTGINPVFSIQADMEKIEFSIRVVADRINKTFYSDLFLMFSQSNDPKMTATEVITRDSEKMLALAPVLDSINNELISPLIEYTVAKIIENGLIEEPPEELQGREIKIDYISMIAQAQKMVGTNSIEQLVAFIGNLSAVDPTVLDNIDFDETTKIYSTKLGVSPKMLRSKGDIAALREARATQMANQQMQENALASIDGAKVLSQTKIQDNTALTELTGATQ